VIAIRDLYHLFVIVLIRLSSWRYSSRLKTLVVGGIAVAAYTLSKRKRQAMERSLSAAFEGRLSPAQRQRIIKTVFRETWGGIFSWMSSGAERRSVEHAELQGVERLRAAIEAGRGVILWESSGFGRRIDARRVLHANGFLIHQVHGPDNLGGFFSEDSPATRVRLSFIKRFFDDCERQFVTDLMYLPRPGSGSLAFGRQLRQRLERNAIICITGDGKFGRKLIPVEMLGVTEFFATGMVTLARASGAAILPLLCVPRTDGNLGVIIESPIVIDRGGSRERALQEGVVQYARLLEGYIRRYPERYRNWHVLGTSGGKDVQGLVPPEDLFLEAGAAMKGFELDGGC